VGNGVMDRLDTDVIVCVLFCRWHIVYWLVT